MRFGLFWLSITLVVVVPILAAAASPLLAWRDPVYIAAGFAGVLALVVLLFQPLLAAGYLYGFPLLLGRLIHRYAGGLLVLLVVLHIAGLWITSPPDMIDALLLMSPTPFSVWGVIAMWGIFFTAALVVLRRFRKIRPVLWRGLHKAAALVIVISSILHAVQIEGTMETYSKFALCFAVAVATISALVSKR